MSANKNNSAKLLELKKLLEELAGRPLLLNAEQLLGLTAPLASSTFISVPYGEVDAWVTNESIVPLGLGLPNDENVSQQELSTLSTTESSILDTCGVVVTGVDGTITFKLSTFVHWQDGISRFLEPVNITATAQLPNPFIVTAIHKMVVNPIFPNSPNWNYIDVSITLYSWTTGGESAPNIPIYWRCRAAATEPIRNFPLEK